MLQEFQLDTQPLRDMANIIRAADTDQLDQSSQAAGLLAISLGYSRIYKNDLEQLSASMGVYDALFRWCRDAQDERHDRQMHTSRG